MTHPTATRAALLCALLLASAAAPAAAQLRALSLVSDNDAYDFWIPMAVRPDHDYTNGLELAAELDAAPFWGRLLARGARPCGAEADAEKACLTTRLDAGQKLFTPRVDAPEPQPGHRPYAGWLYAGATAVSSSRGTRRALAVEVGVTGPPSLGRAVHEGYHSLTGFWEPVGWERGELAFEPGMVLSYDQAHLLGALESSGRRVATLAGEGGASAGNVLTEARAGASARVGWGVPHPWSAAADRGAPRVSVYVLGAVRQRAVARNLFLDGSTFGEGPRAERIPLVREMEVGAGVRIGRLTAEYRAVSPGREYRSEPESHQYGTFAITWRLPERAAAPPRAVPAAKPKEDR